MSRIDTSYRHIFEIAWPVIISSLSLTVMGIVDTLMVGRLGITALAGVGLANFLCWWFFSFFWGLLSGVSTLVAQAKGADRPTDIGTAFWHGFYFALASSLLLLACIPLAPFLLTLTQAGTEAGAVAEQYLVLRLLGGAGFMITVAAENVYRGLGETRLPMLTGLLLAVLNCFFNFGLIFGHWGLPALGVRGAAIGTVLAYLVVAIALLASLFARRRFRPFQLRSTFRPKIARFRQLAAVSIPVAFQYFIELSGFSIFSALVVRLGDAEMAASNVVVQAWSIAFMSCASLGVAATSLTGQAVGAGVPEQGRIAVERILRLGYGVTAILAVVYLGFSEPLMTLFVEPSEAERLLPFAVPLFAVVVLCLVPDLVFIVVSGALQGAGDTAYCMWTNAASTWLIFVPSVYLSIEYFGLVAAWLCFVVHSSFMALVLRRRLRGEGWIRGTALDEPSSAQETDLPIEPTNTATAPAITVEEALETT